MILVIILAVLSLMIAKTIYAQTSTPTSSKAATPIVLGLHNLVGGAIETANITLQAKEKVTGSFNFSSASPIDISIGFSIRDPRGKSILNSFSVVGGENFSFTADYSGMYTLIFDNSASSYPKYLQLEYTVSSSTSSPTSTNAVPEFPTLIILPLLLSVFSVVVIVRHRQVKKL